MTPEQANLNAQTIGNLSEGFSKATRTVFEQMYDGKTEPTQYFEEMNNFRMQGRNGEDFAPRDDERRFEKNVNSAFHPMTALTE